MLKRKGQNIAEYSILIALVIAAAVAMQVYIKRGIQGRVANAVDHAPTLGNIAGDAGDGTNLDFTRKQYEPYYQESVADVDSTRGLKEVVAVSGKTDRTNVVDVTTRQKITSYEK